MDFANLITDVRKAKTVRSLHGFRYIVQNDKNITAQGQYFNTLPALYLFPRNDNFEEIRMFERYSESRGVNVQFWPYGHQGLSLQNCRYGERGRVPAAG